MRVGGLRQVVPDSLAFHFEILARGTACEGAAPRCSGSSRRGCAARAGAEWELEELSFRCPRCGGGQTSVVAGEELLVESIEVEEEPCTAPR